jgi:hypothetical protein
MAVYAPGTTPLDAATIGATGAAMGAGDGEAPGTPPVIQAGSVEALPLPTLMLSVRNEIVRLITVPSRPAEMVHVEHLDASALAIRTSTLSERRTKPVK